MPIRIRLKEILAERDMSQRELARLMNVRPNTINRLCNDNVTTAFFETLEHICKTLNIGLHELLIMEDDQIPPSE
ncbi:helix-turn-helix transcriptional regulator [Paenibacillus alba]|uniref:helix-turn-helix domain-containing protein n=1 Tax=Paenibacillus alba TaxID=1197127 RepID=UPI001564C866|nr:helix-turn-helix transcriptional regulator [Paenibacillus alba]NQX64622.1 helix-turn-helix transcriptional regulator [Paenibacillus alba]